MFSCILAEAQGTKGSMFFEWGSVMSCELYLKFTHHIFTIWTRNLREWSTSHRLQGL